MSKFKMILILLTFSTSIHALSQVSDQTSTQRQASSLATILRGSEWQGSYRSVFVEHTVRIAFLEELTAKGEVQYFHKTVGFGEVPEALSVFDSASEFTPRALAVNRPNAQGTITGTISVFKAVKTLDEELKLEEQPQRETQAKVRVKEIMVSGDGSALIISAVIGGITVHYNLTRAEVVARPLARSILKSWVDALQ